MELLTRFQEDVLTDILQSIRLRSTLYCRATMRVPWGFRVSERSVASFHIVTGGTCWLTVDGVRRPVLLAAGDLVILPHGHAHTMTDDPKTPVTRLEDLKPKQPVREDGIFYSLGQGAVTTLVCGGIQLEDYATNPVCSLLPAFIHLKSLHGKAHPWLSTIVKLVKLEAGANQPEAETIITRLSEILFIRAIRAYMCTVADTQTGWFGALKDPQIGQALALLQQHPDEPWTVDSLASRASLSRSAFSAKFKLLVGESPMHYLTRIRLTKAATLLRTQSTTLFEVAASIGYDSDVAFSKAFKRQFGVAPGAYRQGKRSPEELNGTREHDDEDQ